MTGCLLDTNVVAELANPKGAPRVHAWAAEQQEADLFLSVLTLGEYDKGIYHLASENPVRSRVAAAVVGLELRFAGRILSVSDTVVRRWGAISGLVKRMTGHSPPVIDTLLAATAIEHDLCFVTRNVRDVEHSGVLVFNPWTDPVAKL